jgi:hypothetical protein
MVRGANTINGAYSYPDPVLTTPSVSQNPSCAFSVP